MILVVDKHKFLLYVLVALYYFHVFNRGCKYISRPLMCFPFLDVPPFFRVKMMKWGDQIILLMIEGGAGVGCLKGSYCGNVKDSTKIGTLESRSWCLEANKGQGTSTMAG